MIIRFTIWYCDTWQTWDSWKMSNLITGLWSYTINTLREMVSSSALEQTLNWCCMKITKFLFIFLSERLTTSNTILNFVWAEMILPYMRFPQNFSNDDVEWYDSNHFSWSWCNLLASLFFILMQSGISKQNSIWS